MTLPLLFVVFLKGEIQMNNIEVSVSKLNEIIESRQPAGVFYANDNGIYIGVDNRTGDAWTEDFHTKNECLLWLGLDA